MRMRKKKNQDERVNACQNYMISTREELLQYQDRLPCALEIGCGKGGFICQMAMRNPDKFYIALEVSTGALITAMERCIAEKIENIRFINANAVTITELFEKGEVSKIYLNFSDPWPKARHTKRRLTYRSFLELYRTILPEDGVLEFKTDNRPLFDFSLEEFAFCNMKVTDITYDLHNSIYNENNIMTEYERNFSEKGFTINRAVVYMHT